MTSLGMGRLGWLWCNWGRLGNCQVIPQSWMREATETAPDILANFPEEQWQYGHRFWAKDYGRYFRSRRRDSFAASSAGLHHVHVGGL